MKVEAALERTSSSFHPWGATCREENGGGKGRLVVLETVVLRGHQPEGAGIKRSVDRRAIDSCQLDSIQNGDMRIEAFQFVERDGERRISFGQGSSQ